MSESSSGSRVYSELGINIPKISQKFYSLHNFVNVFCINIFYKFNSMYVIPLLLKIIKI